MLRASLHSLVGQYDVFVHGIWLVLDAQSFQPISHDARFGLCTSATPPPGTVVHFPCNASGPLTTQCDLNQGSQSRHLPAQVRRETKNEEAPSRRRPPESPPRQPRSFWCQICLPQSCDAEIDRDRTLTNRRSRRRLCLLHSFRLSSTTLTPTLCTAPLAFRQALPTRVHSEGQMRHGEATWPRSTTPLAFVQEIRTATEATGRTCQSEFADCKVHTRRSVSHRPTVAVDWVTFVAVVKTGQPPSTLLDESCGGHATRFPSRFEGAAIGFHRVQADNPFC
ncbi:hypothetical protein LX36DRAFT_70532 [Colletotrichum falcatum]|nr:hypothetical protein LX36DRAFT_70532 [Colletotrichum falcatum]